MLAARIPHMKRNLAILFTDWRKLQCMVNAFAPPGTQCQGEMRAETTLAALELGRAEGMITLFNPAPAVKDLPDRWNAI